MAFIRMLKAKIISVTDDRVTLECEDGQTLHVPRSTIQGVPKQGMEIAMSIFALGAEDAGRGALARDLLNTLLSA